jgi:hypothetical protein
VKEIQAKVKMEENFPPELFEKESGVHILGNSVHFRRSLKNGGRNGDQR